jgi:L,D-transpeptidase catalytic domain
MKYLYVFLILATCFATLFFTKNELSAKAKAHIVAPIVKSNSSIDANSIHKRATKLKQFAANKNYSEEYCFLINMKLPSGKKRFYIYNFKTDTVVASGLVTHGGGSETDSDSLVFSNTPNSGSTSLGKYKVGVAYTGKFGLAYKLHGLDSSNNNAFDRFVVLHSHGCVPANETNPFEICTSLGCPTVNPGFLNTLKAYIEKSKKPILLWIYY